MLVYFGLCFQSEGKRGIKKKPGSGLRNWVAVHLRKTEEGVGQQRSCWPCCIGSVCKLLVMMRPLDLRLMCRAGHRNLGPIGYR